MTRHPIPVDLALALAVDLGAQAEGGTPWFLECQHFLVAYRSGEIDLLAVDPAGRTLVWNPERASGSWTLYFG